MKNESGILLQNHFVNNMKIGGELGWFARDYNASSGYFWRYRPDNSGVYEIVEEVTLHSSADAVGVPGMIIWKLEAKREGKGTIVFEQFPPSGTEPAQTIAINIKVNK